MNLATREPVIAVGAITTAIVAVLAMTNAFGITTITEAQRDALVAAVVALWPILLVIRQLVTPVRAPRLPAGTHVKHPDGTTGVVVPK